MSCYRDLVWLWECERSISVNDCETNPSAGLYTDVPERQRPWYDVSCWKFLVAWLYANLYANQPTAILWHKPFTSSYCQLITYIIFSDGSKSSPDVFFWPPLRELVLNQKALSNSSPTLNYTADSFITPASCYTIWL